MPQLGPFAPLPPSPKYTLDFTKLMEHTDRPIESRQLTRQTIDHPILHKGFALNEKLRGLQQTVGNFQHESDEINKDFARAARVLDDAVRRQAKLHDDLQVFYDDLGAQARKAVFDLPIDQIRLRYPHWTRPEEHDHFPSLNHCRSLNQFLSLLVPNRPSSRKDKKKPNDKLIVGKNP
jgi:hypothetical protein